MTEIVDHSIVLPWQIRDRKKDYLSIFFGIALDSIFIARTATMSRALILPHTESTRNVSSPTPSESNCMPDVPRQAPSRLFSLRVRLDVVIIAWK